jgi:hypothetical protein
MFDPDRARQMKATIAFRFGEDRYFVTIGDGKLIARRGEPEVADLVISGEPTMLAAVVYAKQPLDLVGIEGDRALFQRFVDLFELPPKVGADGS